MRSRCSIFLNDSCQGSDNIASQAPIRKRRSQNLKPRLCWVSFFRGGGLILSTHVFKQLQYLPPGVSTRSYTCVFKQPATSAGQRTKLQNSRGAEPANTPQRLGLTTQDVISKSSSETSDPGIIKVALLCALLVLLNLSSLFAVLDAVVQWSGTKERDVTLNLMVYMIWLH